MSPSSLTAGTNRRETAPRRKHSGSIGAMRRNRQHLASARENDGAVNQDDSFQVYLTTSGSSYAQLVVNPLGYLLDSSGMAGGQRLSRAREWDSGTLVSVRREAGAWKVRMKSRCSRRQKCLGKSKHPQHGSPSDASRPGRDGEPRETGVLPVIQSETPLCPARYRRMSLPTRIHRSRRSYPNRQPRRYT